MIKCSECGADISDKAITCPKCGYPTNGEAIKETTQKPLGNSDFNQVFQSVTEQIYNSDDSSTPTESSNIKRDKKLNA